MKVYNEYLLQFTKDLRETRKKLHCRCCQKGIEFVQLFSLEIALILCEKGFIIPLKNHYQIVKSEKHKAFCVSKLSGQK